MINDYMDIILRMADELTLRGEYRLGQQYLMEAGETQRSIPPRRIGRDAMFIEIAKTVAKRSTCPRANVGALIVRDNRIISMGYNGSEPGEPHCIDEGCIQIEGSGCKRTIHAEDNAIRFAKQYNISIHGATLYCTHTPCANCARFIVDAGITQVVYSEWYKGDSGQKLFSESGIGIRHEQGAEEFE